MAGTTTKDTYVLELVDKILAPLKAIEKQATKVADVLERVEKLACGGLSLAKVVGGVGLAVGAMGLLAKGVGLVADMFAKGAEMAWEFGKRVVEATRFRGTNISALDLFLGKGRGEGVFNRALEFGKFLPMDERDVVRQVKELAAAGYSGKQADAVNAALADVQALQGDAARENLLFHFKRLKNEAAPEARDVKMAAIDTGVGMEGIFRQVYAAKGMKLPHSGDETKDLFAMAKQYEHWKKHGEVSGNDIANAILRAISERYDAGGKLGGAAIARGDKTLGGLLTNLEAAPERFLMQMQLEKMPGIKAVMEFIKRLLVYFDHATPQGKKLASVVERLINTLFGGLDRIQAKDLERFFEAGVRQAERLIKVVQELVGPGGLLDQLLHGDFTGLAAAAGAMIREVGRFLGMGIWEGFKLAIGGQVAQMPVVKQAIEATAGTTSMAAGSRISVEKPMLSAVTGLAQTLSSILPGLSAAWHGAGGALGSVGKGVSSAVAGVGSAGDSAVKGFTDAWRGMTGVPKMAAGGIVDKPTLALIGEAGPEAVVPLSQAGGVTVHVGAIHLSGDDDSARAQSFVSQLITELQSSGLRVGAH